jgi:hypothetical protein
MDHPDGDSEFFSEEKEGELKAVGMIAFVEEVPGEVPPFHEAVVGGFIQGKIDNPGRARTEIAVGPPSAGLLFRPSILFADLGNPLGPASCFAGDAAFGIRNPGGRIIAVAAASGEQGHKDEYTDHVQKECLPLDAQALLLVLLFDISALPVWGDVPSIGVFFKTRPPGSPPGFVPSS